MLRLRRARILPPLTASRQSQRLIWSPASGFMAWLGFGDTNRPTSSTNPTKQLSVQPKTPRKRWASKREHVLRPQPSADASFPTVQKSLSLKRKKNAVHALGRLSQKIKNVSSSKQLLDAWKIISQCRPFVVQEDEPFQVQLASVENVQDNDSWLLQIVPANVFAKLSAKLFTRIMFVGSTQVGPFDTDVVVANETVMVGYFVKAFHRMKEHELVVTFFEAYDRDRGVWLQEHQLHAEATVPDDGLSDGDKEEEAKPDYIEKQVLIKRVTRLPRTVYSCYLRSLAALRQSKKIVRFFEDNEHQLERICVTVPNLHLILHACYNEKNGALARRAIDTILKCSPAAVIPLGCYELAIRANLCDRKRDEQGLLSAIHLAQALLNDGGFILKPDIWSRLVKASLVWDRPDLALDVFKTYPRHCIPEYQSNFRQVLRTASRLAGSTALEMMHFCWVSYDADYPDRKMLLDERKAYKDTIYLNNPEVKALSLGDAVLPPNIPVVNKEAETDMLNTMMWDLLKHCHDVPSTVQVLDLMESTCSKGGGVALRKAVVSMFEYDMNEKKMSPRAAVESSLNFWKEHSTVLHGQGFLVHVLLEECIKHQLDDECEFLVNYLLDVGVGRVPVNSVVKMMEANELRGRFEANARIGDKLLYKLFRSNRGKLRDDFYERYLMSYLRLEQFDKVGQQYAYFNLEQRFPYNKVIRTIVQDAAAQEDKF
ncbi:unnamed protein product [Peronospora effusa]|uniref:Uncharacterized protein n=1 Tax=Peronospora effusa TaxID=542832 RepID=A0A3R7XEI5_9STRA|nr:hypothetical protein DD237_003078 [Peronospora effusa]CAI5723804.1 unnamed protein product [Peronospora effusa]